MAREITTRELRTDICRVMRALDAGESFVITRNGTPVGELRPVQRDTFVATSVALEAFAYLAPIDGKRFRKDVDSVVDQDAAPSG